ncbi:hypothetical protein ACVWYH_008216 [Bradyrhizobium sp. GM24.11]
MFWWSACRISIGLPLILPPNASAAIRAASTEPGPIAVAKMPFMSVRTPIRMASPLISARAVVPASASVINRMAVDGLRRLAMAFPDFIVDEFVLVVTPVRR